MALFAFAASVALEFSPIIRDGVLQRGVPVSVWGSGATPSARVTVRVGSQQRQVEVNADAHGNWTATLPSHATAWALPLHATSGGRSTSTTVSFGLVLLCAGQSNMDMPVACHVKNCTYPKLAFHADNGTAEAAAAGRYAGRISVIKAVQSKYEQRTGLPTWHPASPESVKPFSAICWYTGKALSDGLEGQVPVGLMQTSVGGSPIEYWLPPSGIVDKNACEVDRPQCDKQYNDSWFFTDVRSDLLLSPDGPIDSSPLL